MLILEHTKADHGDGRVMSELCRRSALRVQIYERKAQTNDLVCYLRVFGHADVMLIICKACSGLLRRDDSFENDCLCKARVL